MSIPKVTLNEPKKRNSILPSAAIGAVAGMGARYTMPTKSELSGFVNKSNVDTFVSSAATTARANKRSILKFAGVGAAIAAGISALYNAIKTQKNYVPSDIDATKYGILVDASPYACEIYCYED